VSNRDSKAETETETEEQAANSTRVVEWACGRIAHGTPRVLTARRGNVARSWCGALPAMCIYAAPGPTVPPRARSSQKANRRCHGPRASRVSLLRALLLALCLELTKRGSIRCAWRRSLPPRARSSQPPLPSGTCPHKQARPFPLSRSSPLSLLCAFLELLRGITKICSNNAAPRVAAAKRRCHTHKHLPLSVTLALTVSRLELCEFLSSLRLTFIEI